MQLPCFRKLWYGFKALELSRRFFTDRFIGAAAYYYLMREQNKAEPEILESTSSYHFLAFFITGMSIHRTGKSTLPIPFFE
jgi:hypothetical protein